MSNTAKLKKKALELEQKKQFDKALAVYVQIIESSDASSGEDLDVAIYNRVGDLMLRQGDVAQALTYYESAVDLYSEQGFFNNAIALCNKVLRQNPGRTSIYYKLGKISARKGFISDAKQNFLEYADRMQKSGQLDEAFRALKEFADLCPDQDDIRLMLADQLTRRERKGEALEQLQTLYDKFAAEGRDAEARATVDRMKSIDPSMEPRASGAQPKQQKGDLVFLDVGFDEKGGGSKPAARPSAAESPKPKAAPKPAPAPPRAAPPPPPRAPDVPLGGLPLIMPDDQESASYQAATPVAEPEPEVDTMAGLEFTSLGGDANEDGPLTGSEFATLPLEASADRPAVAPSHDLALPGELPPLDLGAPMEVDSNLGGGGDFDFGLAGGTLLDIDGPDAGSSLGGELPMLSLQDGAAGSASLEAPLDISFDSSLDAGSGAAALGGGIEPSTLDFLASAGGDEMSEPSIGGDLPMLDESAPPPARGVPTPAGDAAFLAMMTPAADSPPGANLPPSAAVEPAELDYLAHAAPAPARAAAPAAPLSPLELVQSLRNEAVRRPDDWELRRRYAEALLDAGEREAGLAELEQSMIGLERADDLDGARSVADEIVRLDPSSVRNHQKRVEYAFRANDKVRLCDAYLQLADALFRTGQAEKSRVVYHRVLEINPDDLRARGALSAFVDDSDVAAVAAAAKPAPSAAPAGRPAARPRVGPPPTKGGAKPAAPAPVAIASSGDDSFVNLGDMLRDDGGPKSTRMVVAEEEPSGDEAADFADMLRKFKQGVAENVDDDDHESHYDLGVAYKEMGLVDEAIAEFQKALRAPGRRVRTYEALGQCFIEKRQFQVATTILARALSEPDAGDDQLVGVLYLLGYACEALQRLDDALGYYQRVFAVDIQFRDVTDRLAAVEKVAR
ncbi:MAG TPA: tetratricopeptide repeat protein [Gaiellaceae bacterium]|nr:tetratricopeptide repeat protein [Gaiellaceae bacterium]